MIDDVMTDDDTMIRARPAGGLIKYPWDMDVYQHAYKASLAIHKKTIEFPQIEQYALASQLRRASKSICANIGEGFIKQKYSRAEFARFITIAEASSTEVRIWLRYALDLQYMSQSQFNDWDDAYAAISAMLSKLHKSLK